MRFISVVAATVLCVTAGTANASLIFLGPDASSGAGLGSVETALTISSQGSSTTESGCVSAGTGGATVTGATACPAAGPNGLDPFTGGDETAINEAHAAAALGLTDFADLRIVFNAAEPGNSGGGITIDNLSLTLWDPTDGSILAAFYITAEQPFADTNPGVGSAGFLFGLDAAQAADANLLLTAFPGLFLGLAANASDATGGLETFAFAVADGDQVQVPEPMTLTLLGFGLTALGLLRWKRSV